MRYRILQDADNPDEAVWLPGARMNIAESALSVQDPDAPALVWADEADPTNIHTLSLGQLRTRCYQCAAALRASGFSPGARVRVLDVICHCSGVFLGFGPMDFV
jgi:hypothetical protein